MRFWEVRGRARVRAARAAEAADSALDDLRGLGEELPCFGSFSEDTEVATKDGEKAIDEVQAGDWVLAYDEQTDTTGYYPVDAVAERQDQTIVHLVIDDEEITTTPEHPFFTKESGWVNAGELQADMHVRQADGSYEEVQSVQTKEQPQAMYNLTVHSAHTFFVGEGKWLVHNECPIYAHVQKNASPEHNAKMLEIAHELARSGKYEEVWMDSYISTSTHYQVAGPTKPNIVGLNFTRQRAYVVEVASPTQILKSGYTQQLLRAARVTRSSFKFWGWSVVVQIVKP